MCVENIFKTLVDKWKNCFSPLSFSDFVNISTFVVQIWKSMDKCVDDNIYYKEFLNYMVKNCMSYKIIIESPWLDYFLTTF